MGNLAALHDMTLFVEVARTESFSRASRNLEVPGATLSRRIAALEREFGVRLFNRSTRKVELTDAGRRYFERCQHLVDEARLAQESLRESAELPSGHVRLSMPVDLGVFVIGPLLPEFARQFPGISFDLDLSPRHTDLVSEHVDVAIRLSAVKDEQLIVRRLGSIEQALYASPAYLERGGRPQQPADLVEHECIVVRSAQRQALWCLQRERESAEVAVRGRFMVNNLGLMRLLSERGMGIAALAPSLVREAVASGRLVPVLPEWTVPRLPIQAVLASHLQPACVRALLDFLAARLTAV
jgi:DNA-binding transcriptional LysR family regulator